MYENEEGKPITPREVRERIKERYTLPKNVIDYVNEQILLTFNTLDGNAFMKYHDFVKHFTVKHAGNTVDNWWDLVMENFSNDWIVEECDIKFEYSRKYRFKERKVKRFIV